ncbi:hypothetical protein [Reinekea marinisedimentorum]|uniref:Pre-peptidase n=1 Tax=Reinekea marinisedimentorum TaxID=230495 RepID=A0A4R3I4R5_9GAMM|nr:hypothetical protein [Reinekea marinisedimentorum]TCS40226.1 hypothetical protein BCF53_110148 [Reinekea marinisedimentorum]
MKALKPVVGFAKKPASIKAKTFAVLPLTLMMLTACNFATDEDEGDSETVTRLSANSLKTDSISSIGEVDWYEYYPESSDSQINVEVTSATLRSDIELLVTMYQKEDEELVRLYADHATEGSVTATDLHLVYGLDNSEPVLIAVRDLMDDAKATGNYSIKVYEGTDDSADDTLAGATDITVNGECLIDTVSTNSDVDMYSFTLESGAISTVDVDFSNALSDTNVSLNIKLYSNNDGATSLVENWYSSVDEVYSMTDYLDAGNYLVSVADFGQNDSDASSPYEICVTSTDTEEAMTDDTAEDATSVDLTTDVASVTGSLGYSSDEDWYLLEMPSVTGDDLSLLSVTLDANTSDMDILYVITDASGEIVFSYVHTAGSAAYSLEVLLSSGDYTLTVSLDEDQVYSESASYSVALETTTVTDADETGDANNTSADAYSLTSGEAVTGKKISYAGDIDWYVINVPASDNYQRLVFELSFTDGDSAVESDVDFRMLVNLDDDAVVEVVDPVTGDAILDLQEAVLVAPNEEGLNYYIKISDEFAKKSDANATYSLMATLEGLNDFSEDNLPSVVTDYLFAEEADEQAQYEADEDILELILSAASSEFYAVDMDTLNFSYPDDAADNATVTENDDGTLTIAFPWLGGYIDFSGDQDWYAIDLNGLAILEDTVSDPAVEAETDWHYLIQVELVANEGENSEYTWSMYRDVSQNMEIEEQETTSGEGVFSQVGDTTLTDDAVDLDTADYSTDFWVDEQWEGTFYIAVKDFEYLNDPDTSEDMAVTDADWSGEATPYFIRVTLTYVPTAFEEE